MCVCACVICTQREREREREREIDKGKYTHMRTHMRTHIRTLVAGVAVIECKAASLSASARAGSGRQRRASPQAIGK